MPFLVEPYPIFLFLISYTTYSIMHQEATISHYPSEGMLAPTKLAQNLWFCNRHFNVEDVLYLTVRPPRL
jgi:hypothetical protein